LTGSRGDRTDPGDGDILRGDTGSFRYRGSAHRATQGEPVVPQYPSRVDLHTHSRRSDGVLEPAALVEAACEVGVKVLALADHDTLAGVRELRAASGILLLELIAGVEINSIAAAPESLWEGELHILGLGVDLADDAFEAALQRQRDMRADRFRRIVAQLAELGFGIDGPVEQFLAVQGAAAGASLGRPQIARCLVEAGHAASVDDAMKRLLARGRPGYVARQGLGPVEAIAAIRAAGGLPVLAHFADAVESSGLVRELTAAGLGGLEVHYRHFDVDTVSGLSEVARALRLVPTGGSDYHGDGETYAEAHAHLFVPDEDVEALRLALFDRRATASAVPAEPADSSGSREMRS
jgi:predicted metal-dependent phosphoesterase TrpH